MWSWLPDRCLTGSPPCHKVLRSHPNYMSPLALEGGVLILEPGGPSPHLLRTQLQLHLCVLLRLACFMVIKVYGLLLHV